jgi:hypothetical protein
MGKQTGGQGPVSRAGSRLRRLIAIGGVLAVAIVAAAAVNGNRSSPRVVHTVATASRHPLLEIGNIPNCRTGASPVRVLRHYHARALRAVVTPDTFKLGVMKCARSAVAAGYRVHLVIQWWDRWKDSRIESFFRSVLRRGQPRAWAVSIGNEQELRNHGGKHGITASAYARIWRRVEPIVASRAPHAVRVAGEISPWHLTWLKQVFTHHLRGVQAVAGHPYAFPHTWTPRAFASFARSHHLPYWFDEGYKLRGVWQPKYARSAHKLAGAAVLGAWLA